MRTYMIAAVFCVASMGFALSAYAQGRSKSTPTSATTVTTSRASNGNRAAQDQEFSLAEGEKKFRQNCGRCHVAPDKYPPRVMATVLRHMRVRATITDREAKLILWYMTQ